MAGKKRIFRPDRPVPCACGCGQMTHGKYVPSLRGYPRFLPRHHLHLRRKPETQRKPQPCKCGCGQMTQGWFNYRTHKYSEYVKGHDAPLYRKKGWSRDYPACIHCGTTTVKYGSHGLCQNCEYHLLRKNKPGQRARRHDYFNRYYIEKKRDSGYYERYRRTPACKLAQRKNRYNWDDPDLSLYYRNRDHLLIVENRPCERCGSLERREVDHIVLRCRGGKSDLSNLRVLCFSCHREAGKGRHSTEPR